MINSVIVASALPLTMVAVLVVTRFYRLDDAAHGEIVRDLAARS